jgi:hypothetical protein
MFASDDAFDLAIAMYDRAQAIRPSPLNDERVRQIQMNKRLATKYSTVRSDHFEVHYPEDVHVVTAKQIDDILEAELRRIQKWVPVAHFERVVVNVVWWDEFRSTYTGSDFILGFYNGKITVRSARRGADVARALSRDDFAGDERSGAALVPGRARATHRDARVSRERVQHVRRQRPDCDVASRSGAAPVVRS